MADDIHKYFDALATLTINDAFSNEDKGNNSLRKIPIGNCSGWSQASQATDLVIDLDEFEEEVTTVLHQALSTADETPITTAEPLSLKKYPETSTNFGDIRPFILQLHNEQPSYKLISRDTTPTVVPVWARSFDAPERLPKESIVSIRDVTELTPTIYVAPPPEKCEIKKRARSARQKNTCLWRQFLRIYRKCDYDPSNRHARAFIKPIAEMSLKKLNSDYPQICAAAFHDLKHADKGTCRACRQSENLMSAILDVIYLTKIK